jgi:hypothetical protein
MSFLVGGLRACVDQSLDNSCILGWYAILEQRD